MKKLLVLLLTLVMLFALIACNNNKTEDPKQDDNTVTPTPDDTDDVEPELVVMTYEQFLAAELNDPVCVEVYVQATQGWYFDSETGKDVITVYAADQDGAYFIYKLECSEADSAKLTPGTKIRVNGYKTAWSGEVEIVDATFEFVEAAPYIAEAVDVTELFAHEDLIDYQNFLVSFKELTVKEISYKNGTPGNDIYVTLTLGEAEHTFCVESYLTSPDSDVYKTVGTLKAGDVVDVEGFLYWYEGPNTHITNIKLSGVMTYDEYVDAQLNDKVVVEAYVQATQGWWFNSSVGHGVITVYAQDQDGAYFLYDMTCTEEDAAKLTPGTKIRVTGYKAEWSGEVEIVDATFELVDANPWLAEPKDLTELLGKEDLISYQNQLAIFYGLTVKEITYKNGAPGNDIYITLDYNGNSYTFCVESYLTGPDTELYQLVGTLNAGDVIDVTGFLYWYEGVNTHITGVTVK